MSGATPRARLLDRIDGLYGIVDLPPSATPSDALRLGDALLAGGARVLQLRMKGALGGALFAAAHPLARLARERDAAFVVNDRVDIALATSADGVHLGQDDLPLADARRLAPALAIGLSAHTLSQAQEAMLAGADYLGFGPVFPTRTKERPDPTTGLEALAATSRALPTLPIVAIGGITQENGRLVGRSGVTAFAPIAALIHVADPTAAARALLTAFQAGRSDRANDARIDSSQ